MIIITRTKKLITLKCSQYLDACEIMNIAGMRGISHPWMLLWLKCKVRKKDG